MITKDELNVLLPHGKRILVAEKAGVSPAAVTKYLDNKIKSSHRIQKAALEVAFECQSEIKLIEKKLRKIK